MKWLKPAVVFLVCCISAILWCIHAVQAPFFNEDTRRTEAYLRAMYDKLAPDLQQERRLAKAYWRRYPDVRENQLWGEDGVLGIKGPADHYRNHGRQEGRIYKEIDWPEDIAQEKKLAQAYWDRYPDVAASAVWGRRSSMGVLGPRDHYRLFGRMEGRHWGE